MKQVQFNTFDADGDIMWKKDKLEVGQWMDSLGFIDKELGFLTELEDRFLEDPDLYAQIQQKQRENTLVCGELFRYEKAMTNALECEDLACDAYYIDYHEEHRSMYMEHLKGYRELKSNLFSILLEGTGS